MTIEISNHESSQVLWNWHAVGSAGTVDPSGTTDADDFQLLDYFPECLWQTATVSPRTDTEPVPGIGFEGAATVQSRTGSVDISLEGFIIGEPGGAGNEKTLNDLDAKMSDGATDYYTMTLMTFCDDYEHGGTGLPFADSPATICHVTGLWCNSITFTAEANAPMRFSTTIVGDACTWSTCVGVTPIDVFAAGYAGDDIELKMAKDITLTLNTSSPANDDQSSYDDPPAADYQMAALSCTVTGNVGRRDAYVIGLETPFARIAQRPHEVTAAVEVYSSNLRDLEGVFNPNFTWDPDNTATVTVTSDAGNTYFTATQLRPSDASLNVNVGADVTTTLNFSGWKLAWYPAS